MALPMPSHLLHQNECSNISGTMPSAEVATLLATPAPVFRLLPSTGTSVQVPVRVGPIDLGRPSFIDKCHGLGLRVDYWTINDPAEATRLLECGADGIMTDDPRRIAPCFAAFRERSGDTRSWHPCPSR